MSKQHKNWHSNVFHFAFLCGQTEILKKLFNSSVFEDHIKRVMKKTILYHAAEKGQMEIVQFIIQPIIQTQNPRQINYVLNHGFCDWPGWTCKSTICCDYTIYLQLFHCKKCLVVVLIEIRRLSMVSWLTRIRNDSKCLELGGDRWVRGLTGGKVRCGARGVEVRALRGGLTLVSITKTCSIDSSRRDASIEHGFMVGTNQERLWMYLEVDRVRGQVPD